MAGASSDSVPAKEQLRTPPPARHCWPLIERGLPTQRTLPFVIGAAKALRKP
jgi:hypothetical protein